MSSPGRRRFLRTTGAAGSAALAGCFGRVRLRRPDADPPTDRPDGFWRWVNVVEVDGPPAAHRAAFDLTVTQPWTTADAVARVESTLTNEADVARRFDPGLVYSMAPAGGGIRLWEVTDNRDDQRVAPWCLDNDGKADRPVGEAGAQPAGVHLGPGESLVRVAVVVDDREQRGCHPRGVFDFQTRQTVRVDEDDEGQSHEVTFSLGVQGKN